MFGRRSVSIRTSLLRSFILVILVSSLIVLALMWYQARKTESDLSTRLTASGTKQAHRELDRFLQPARKGTQIGTAWGRSGKLRLDQATGGFVGDPTPGLQQEVRRINGLLLPLLQSFPRLSSVQVANDRGQGFLVLVMPDGSVRNRIVDRTSWDTQTLWFDVEKDGTPLRPEWKDVDYDPNARAWYTQLEDAAPGDVCWTEPYIFFTTKDLGITASAKWIDDGHVYVVAFDVLLTELTKFTQDPENQVSENAQTVIGTSEWRVLGLPRHPNYADPESIKAAFLLEVDELDTPEMKAAVAAAPATGGESSHVFPFESDGEDWWAGVKTYDELGEGRDLRIAILVPSEDLLSELAKQRIFLLIATAIALVAALIYSLLLARSYSRPIVALAAQSRRIRDLDFSSDDRIKARLHEFRELATAQEQSLAALQSFSKYVPVEIVRELVAAGEVARIGGRTEHLTCLFTDIAGFTSISEGMSPQALTDHMAEYFQAMIDDIRGNGGTVDKMVGDAIVAFWGAPRPIENHTERAVRGVLQCRRTLDRLNRKWASEGLPPLPTRFGLAAGPVVVGNMGAQSRLAYTVLGDTVNSASRLEAVNKSYGTYVLVDESVHEVCLDLFAWRRLDRIVVVGKTEATWIYEILGTVEDTPSDLLTAARTYEEAWDLYASGAFPDAVAVLDRLLAEEPSDAAAERLRKLCHEYQRDPPPDDWDGVTRRKNK